MKKKTLAIIIGTIIGATVIAYAAGMKCNACNGTGWKGQFKCATCGGDGVFGN